MIGETWKPTLIHFIGVWLVVTFLVIPISVYRLLHELWTSAVLVWMLQVKTPVARTPLQSLEEMKTLLQKLSRPRFSLSPTENYDSPPGQTRRFFSLGRHSQTTPTHTPMHTPSPSPAITPQQQHHIEVHDQDCEEGADEDNDNKEEDEELLYEAESPDEAALVQAARAYGCTLLGRSPEQLLVVLPGTGPLAVPLLHLLPFHSARKRMSVVVRHPLTSQVVVYTKGADNVIMELAGTSGVWFHQSLYVSVSSQ